MQGTGQAHHGLQTFDLRVQTLEPRSPTLDIAHHISRSPFTDQTLQPISHISSFTDQNSHLTHHTSDDSPNASPLKSQASRLTPDTSTSLLSHYTYPSLRTVHTPQFTSTPTPHSSPRAPLAGLSDYRSLAGLWQCIRLTGHSLFFLAVIQLNHYC